MTSSLPWMRSTDWAITASGGPGRIEQKPIGFSKNPRFSALADSLLSSNRKTNVFPTLFLFESFSANYTKFFTLARRVKTSVWAGKDSNLRSRKAPDLQSVVIDRSTTDPSFEIVTISEPSVGLEPTTDGLQNRCSTNWAKMANKQKALCQHTGYYTWGQVFFSLISNSPSESTVSQVDESLSWPFSVPDWAWVPDDSIPWHPWYCRFPYRSLPELHRLQNP